MRFLQGFVLSFLVLSFSAQAAEIKDLVKKVTEEISRYEFENNIACIMVDNSFNGSLTPKDGLFDKHGVVIKYFCKEASNPEATIEQVVMTLADTKVKLFSNRPIENYELTIKSQTLTRKH